MCGNGDPADVTIDAIPGKIFKGHVTQVGELAILRSSGQAATTADHGEHPGSARFQSGGDHRQSAGRAAAGTFGDGEDSDRAEERRLTVPIQALAVRTQKANWKKRRKKQDSSVTLAASKPCAGRCAAEDRRAGRLRDSRQESGVCAGANRNYRRDGHRNYQRIERRRRNRHRQLQSAAHAASGRASQSGQFAPKRDERHRARVRAYDRNSGAHAHGRRRHRSPRRVSGRIWSTPASSFRPRNCGRRTRWARNNCTRCAA